jgi:predicted ATPase
MVISELHLHNFKCFKDERIPIKPLTFLAGINGMGKSTIIQSLLLLRQSRSKDFFELNGELFEFGYYEDIYSEFAEDENFSISLSGIKNESYTWSAKITTKKGESIAEKTSWPEASLVAANLFDSNFQFLSAERWGPRITTPLNTGDIANTYLGKYGEFLVSVLKEFENQPLPNEKLPIHSESNTRDVHEQIGAWMNEISPGATFSAEAIKEADSGIYKFNYRSKIGPTRSFRPTNVGFGLSYTLPILTALLTAPVDSMVIIENPEAHLHPRAQMILGKLLGICANAGVQLIIESHSDHILNGIRIAVKQKLLSKENVVFHFINRPDTLDIATTNVITPKISDDGKLSCWPQGFFDAWDDALDILI